MEQVFTAVMENGRIVIPELVCRRLGLKAGDILRFRVSGDVGTIDKMRDAEDDPFAAFPEWTSAEDDELYRHL